MESYEMTSEKISKLPEHEQKAWSIATEIKNNYSIEQSIEMIKLIKSILADDIHGQSLSLQILGDEMTEL